MSDSSVLLPSSSLAVFSTEDNSRKVASSLSKDWRYARVSVEAVNGGVDDAILYYTSNVSPDLLIIQTDVIDDSFTEKLGELAEKCAEGTDAIIIGPDNDVQLYRKLISMGVSDYIVRPLEIDVFADVIAKTLIKKLGVSGSRLIVTMGCKGGVGVSALTQGLVHGLSELHGQKVLLIDAAGGWSSNTICLGLEPSTTLKEASKAALKEDLDSIDRMILSVSEKLNVLASGGDVMLEPAIDVDGFEKMLNIVMASYPLVIFDASGASAELKKAAIMAAHKVMLFTSPGVFSLRAARTLISEIKDIRDIGDDNKNKELLSLILNFKGIQGKKELAVKDIESMLDCKIDSAIDFMPDMFGKLASEGGKLTTESDGRIIIENLIKSLRSIVTGLSSTANKDESKTSDGGIGGLLKKITGK